MSLLQYHHVSKRFGNTTVLDNINLEIPTGKIIGLLGPNGAGKSTLIKLANTLLTPTTGNITFQNQPLGVASKTEIAYLPERTYLDKTRTIRQTLDFFQNFYLDLQLDTQILHMSKGMQEKLQLILVLSRHVKLYILDEPLGGIDPAARDYILDTILTNFDEGASVLISTHLIADIEKLLDEVIFLQNGKIILQDDADHLRAQTQTSIDEIFRKEFKNAR